MNTGKGLIEIRWGDVCIVWHPEQEMGGALIVEMVHVSILGSKPKEMEI